MGEYTLKEEIRIGMVFAAVLVYGAVSVVAKAAEAAANVAREARHGLEEAFDLNEDNEGEEPRVPAQEEKGFIRKLEELLSGDRSEDFWS